MRLGKKHRCNIDAGPHIPLNSMPSIRAKGHQPASPDEEAALQLAGAPVVQSDNVRPHETSSAAVETQRSPAYFTVVLLVLA
jgi:hypothetical protein